MHFQTPSSLSLPGFLDSYSSLRLESLVKGLRFVTYDAGLDRFAYCEMLGEKAEGNSPVLLSIDNETEMMQPQRLGIHPAVMGINLAVKPRFVSYAFSNGLLPFVDAWNEEYTRRKRIKERGAGRERLPKDYFRS